MGFFSVLSSAFESKPARVQRQPRKMTPLAMLTVFSSANGIVRVINESLKIAANTYSAATKESRLGVVRKKLELLAKMRAKYPFLTVDGMDAFRSDLARVEQMELPVKPKKKAPPKRGVKKAKA